MDALTRIAVAGVLFLLGTTGATAQDPISPYRADYIRDACRTFLVQGRTPDSSGRIGMEGTCAGAVSTVMRFGPMMNEKSRFCPPPEMTLTQVIPIVLKFLDDTPAAGVLDIRDVANYVGRLTWPCK